MIKYADWDIAEPERQMSCFLLYVDPTLKCFCFVCLLHEPKILAKKQWTHILRQGKEYHIVGRRYLGTKNIETERMVENREDK